MRPAHPSESPNDQNGAIGATTRQSRTDGNPLAFDLRILGQLVRATRIACALTALDTADYTLVSPRVLARIENGESVGTERLYRVLTGLGLVALVMPKAAADVALGAIGYHVDWYALAASRSSRTNTDRSTDAVPDKTAPTLLLDFDGTLHVGNAFVDESGQVTLDSRRAPLEFAPLLVELLRPFPFVEIVLTTSWMNVLPVDQVIAFLPQELSCRVVDTTHGMKARFSYLQDGAGRTDIIICYALGKRLQYWLAVDDAVYGVQHFERYPGELTRNFVLLDLARGFSDEAAQQRIRDWLTEVHKDCEA